ncbi:class I SAM-dependent RNA methyltransferase [Rhodobacteraceae bacterium RKSG542]|uniref:class I SAM-dependent RNA methyltransferase n=1 Tax=Pseudovibrio flavus TaxID=2529854 RepID=UPI0012BB9CDF|nr:class I SAM-dependent RNA methyltransferase [Pseudovibrio flavus]MTI18733.1 class I SAM-dependent RNA methyltransferase [Pseudovibrio flavus]
MTTKVQSLEITELAHKGDGVAQSAEGPVFVPFTLPGETVSARIEGQRGTLVSVEKPSTDRVAPVCKHFEACGGCALQHLSADVYAEFKRQQVVDALATRGIDFPVEPLVQCAPHSRRRAVLTAVKAGHKTLLGYHEAKSHRLVDVEECPILHPDIVKALPNLRKMVGDAIPRRKDLKITVVATDNGLDVAISGIGKDLQRHMLNLSQDAMEFGFSRVTADDEMVLELRPPYLAMGSAHVVPPAGGFLQATKSAEEAMSALVLEGLEGCKKVADLFCGSGTFTFRIAERSNVIAAESFVPALRALDNARRSTKGLKNIVIQKRDLFRSPMNAAELYDYGKGCDGVIFDPPRAGAMEQAKELAGANLKKIVAVSCNPATLARDLKILIDGDYKITKVVPIDQFLYSPHVEVVALLERK